MAKLAATTFEGLDRFLGHKDARTIGNNTTAERNTDDTITVRLHGHAIAILTGCAVVVSNAGYGTVTTRDRLNSLLPAGVRAFQKDWTQYLDLRGTIVPMGSGEWHRIAL